MTTKVSRIPKTGIRYGHKQRRMAVQLVREGISYYQVAKEEGSSRQTEMGWCKEDCVETIYLNGSNRFVSKYKEVR